MSVIFTSAGEYYPVVGCAPRAKEPIIAGTMPRAEKDREIATGSAEIWVTLGMLNLDEPLIQPERPEAGQQLVH